MSSATCMLTFFVLVATFPLSATTPLPASTLKHVNILFRHGDRSPLAIYPNDINQIGSWPDGLGWLTNIGKRQQFELGQYLRDRYSGFIDVTHFDHRQVDVQSSSAGRCLMSALSNLAGFFPPQGDQVWNSNIPWQPIPVRSVPPRYDNKLSISKRCSRYDQLLAQQYTSQATLDYIESKQDLFQMASEYSGWEGSLGRMWRLTDTLLREEAHNKTWNSWVTESVIADLKGVAHFAWNLLYKTPEMARLKGGPLLKEMIGNMKAASNGRSGDLRLHMYSAHDITVAALLSAMGVYNHIQPSQGTLVMVELHKMAGGDDVVKVLLRNDTNRDPFLLSVEGCEYPCKLSSFENKMSDMIPGDWHEECKVQNPGKPKSKPDSNDDDVDEEDEDDDDDDDDDDSIYTAPFPKA